MEKELEVQAVEVEDIAVAEDTSVEEAAEEEVSVEAEPSEPVQEVTPPKEDKPSDSVPLNKHMEERKRRQAAEQELQRLRDLQATEAERFKLVQEMTHRGWPEEEAKLQVEKDLRVQRELDEFRKERQKTEIRALAQADEFYNDAEDYADDLLTVMRSKSIGAEEAYMLLHGKRRMRDMKLLTEQRAAVKRKESSEKVVPSGQSAATRDPYPLGADDAKALKGLQQAQPEAKWTREKYYKMLKSIDEQ